MSSTSILPRLALGALATASTASGAIVVFDFPDATRDNYDFPGTLSFSAINLQSASYQTSGATTPRFQVSVSYGSYAYLDFLGGNGVSASASFLSAGDPIGPALGFLSTVSSYTQAVPTGTIYLALRLSDGAASHYGWLEIISTNGSVGQDVFTFTRFAFNDVAGESILAGQTAAVPEASTLGLVGGLFGLVAAAHVRRRKAKQAAASDKCLTLAAGEKLN